MERGQRENRCLKLVQNAMFTQNGEPVRNFITHKNCFEVSDEEFEKNQVQSQMKALVNFQIFYLLRDLLSIFK